MIESPGGPVVAYPSEPISSGMCGHPDCDEPAVYGVRFAGWSADKRTGACAEHAVVARGMANVERIWSLAGTR